MGPGGQRLGATVIEASSAAAVGLARSWAGVERQGKAELGWHGGEKRSAGRKQRREGKNEFCIFLFFSK